MSEQWEGTVRFKRVEEGATLQEGQAIAIVMLRSRGRRRVKIHGLGEGIFNMDQHGSFRNGHWALMPEGYICDMLGSVKNHDKNHWRGEFSILRDGEHLVHGSFEVNRISKT